MGVGRGFGFDRVKLRCLWSLLGPHVGCGTWAWRSREPWAHGAIIMAVKAMASH